MAKFLRQGATHKVVLGPAVAVGDGFTPVTTLALSSADEAEAILHDNGTVVDISGYTWAAITTADGYYHLTLQSGISGTVGHLTIAVNDDSLCLPLREDFMVLEEAVYDALFAASATGLLPANVTQISGGSTAADNLRRSAEAIYYGTVGSSPTTTTLVDAGLTQADNNHWNGRVIIFLTGTLAKQATVITGFAAATDELTFETLTNAPSPGDTYVVL